MFAKSTSISAMPAQSTMSTSHPSWSSPLYDAQARSTCRAVPSATLRFCSPPRPCLPCALFTGKQIRPVCVRCCNKPRPAAAPTSARERLRSCPPPQSPSTDCPAHPLPQPSISGANCAPRLTPAYIPISSSDMTLTPTCNRRSALRIQRIHRLERFLPANR